MNTENKFKHNFNYAFNKLLGIEAGYSNNKYDSGGRTNFGITQTLANKYNIDVKDLTINKAKEIYYNEFWDKYKLNKLDKDIAYELFEFIVNSGNYKLAVKFIQRAYNLYNNTLLKEDGIIGPNTINAINKFSKSNKNNKIFLLKTFNIFQGMYYIAITEDNDLLKEDLFHHKQDNYTKNKHFIKGWINKRVELNKN